MTAEATEADIISLRLFKARRDREQIVEPVIVWWKCRGFSCLNRIGMTQTGLDVFKMFNEVLARQRDRAMREDEIGWCCDEHRGDKKAKRQW